jgi:hypothetical protein
MSDGSAAVILKCQPAQELKELIDAHRHHAKL